MPGTFCFQSWLLLFQSAVLQMAICHLSMNTNFMKDMSSLGKHYFQVLSELSKSALCHFQVLSFVVPSVDILNWRG